MSILLPYNSATCCNLQTPSGHILRNKLLAGGRIDQASTTNTPNAQTKLQDDLNNFLLRKFYEQILSN